MRDANEIAEKVFTDWVENYSKQVSFDHSNSGDMQELGIRRYLMMLLEVFSCEVYGCGEWFESEQKLADHLREVHDYEIIKTDKSYHRGYGDYGRWYFVYDSSVSVKGEDEC